MMLNVIPFDELQGKTTLNYATNVGNTAKPAIPSCFFSMFSTTYSFTSLAHQEFNIPPTIYAQLIYEHTCEMQILIESKVLPDTQNPYPIQFQTTQSKAFAEKVFILNVLIIHACNLLALLSQQNNKLNM